MFLASYLAELHNNHVHVALVAMHSPMVLSGLVVPALLRKVSCFGMTVLTAMSVDIQQNDGGRRLRGVRKTDRLQNGLLLRSQVRSDPCPWIPSDRELSPTMALVDLTPRRCCGRSDRWRPPRRPDTPPF